MNKPKQAQDPDLVIVRRQEVELLRTKLEEANDVFDTLYHIMQRSLRGVKTKQDVDRILNRIIHGEDHLS